VLAFTLAVSLLAGLLFGLLPVVKYAGPHLAGTLRGGGRTMSHGRERHRARDTLVVVQVGLALVLLVGSGLMIRTFQALRSFRPGFTRPGEVQLLRISIPQGEVREPERVMRMEHDMVNRLAAISGVTSVAFANAAPLEGVDPSDVLYAEDKNYAVGQIPPIRRYRVQNIELANVSPGFTVVAPGVFSMAASGIGQAAAFNNGDGTLNGPAHPASVGSLVGIYVTGLGVTDKTVPDGTITDPSLLPANIGTVEVFVGGKNARVLYAGAAPYLPAGVSQVNFVIPDGVPSGNQPLFVSAGHVEGSQSGVWIAVK
jgi:hypothetical protein